MMIEKCVFKRISPISELLWQWRAAREIYYPWQEESSTKCVLCGRVMRFTNREVFISRFNPVSYRPEDICLHHKSYDKRVVMDCLTAVQHDFLPWKPKWKDEAQYWSISLWRFAVNAPRKWLMYVLYSIKLLSEWAIRKLEGKHDVW